MNYYKLEDIENEIDEHHAKLLDKLEDIEVDDEEVYESAAFLLGGARAHLKYIMEDLHFHPIYGNFTRITPLDLNLSFQQSILSFLVYTLLESEDAKEKESASKALELLSYLLDFDHKGSLEYVDKQIGEIKKQEKEEKDDDNTVFNPTLSYLCITNGIICDVHHTQHPTFKALDMVEQLPVIIEFQRIALKGLLVFNNHEEASDE